MKSLHSVLCERMAQNQGRVHETWILALQLGLVEPQVDPGQREKIQ